MGRDARRGELAVRRARMARHAGGDGVRRRGHGLAAGASVAVARREARRRRAVVREGSQRGRVRLRLELGRPRAPHRASATTRRSSSPCRSRRPRATGCSSRRGRTVLLATRLVAAAAREWCGRFRGGGVHVLFPRQTGGGRPAWEESGYLPRYGFQFHWFREGATTFDEYLARFTSKQRNQIKRELRGVAERGITVETLAPGEHTRELARTMHGLLRVDDREARDVGADVSPRGLLRRGGRAFPRIVSRGSSRGTAAGDVIARRVQRGARATTLRALLGRVGGGAVPALRRLLLRGHPLRDRARARRVRARRGRASTSGRAGSSRP